MWRVVPKPASVQALTDCVKAAMATGAQEGGGSGADAGAERPPQGAAAAIGSHFGGDRALYEAFRAGARAQFPADRMAGAQACRRADAAALRHLGHSLRTVLGLLGEPDAAELAWRLQKAAEQVPALDAQGLGEAWGPLDEALARLCA